MWVLSRILRPDTIPIIVNIHRREIGKKTGLFWESALALISCLYLPVNDSTLFLW